MTLVKVGRRYINFDLVRYVDEDVATYLEIVFSDSRGEGDTLHLKGEDASVLLQWLRLNSQELVSPAKSRNFMRAGDSE